MRLALVCFYCLCVFVYVLYFIATMFFAGYFLSVLFCLLSMLISDSRFDLVWFRLSCDHGWIRSGSVNVRKQQQQQQQQRMYNQAAPKHFGMGRLQVPPRQRFHCRPQEEGKHRRHLHSRWDDSSPPTAGLHSQQADKAADAGQVHHLHRVGDCRPQDGQAETAGAWGRVHMMQEVMDSNHP